MGSKTGISWTDSTFNPWRGCSKTSPACANCYADALSKRNPKVLGEFGPNGTRIRAAADMWKQPIKWDEAAEANQQYHSANLPYDAPRPRVFCASLADVFEDWKGEIKSHLGDTLMICPNGHIDGSVWDETPPSIPCSSECGANMRPMTMTDLRRDLFTLIDRTLNLDWLLLTKRPENVLRMWPSSDRHTYFPEAGALNEYPMHHRPNVWLGTTVENQEYADRRIPELLRCRDLAPVLFLSCEPLLGPLNLRKWMGPQSEGQWMNVVECGHDANRYGINWVISGGESGPNSRPSHPDWFRSIRDQCTDAEVPFHFKQWGEWDDAHTCVGGDWPFHAFADGQPMARVGVKSAGRTLDGRTWEEFPEPAAR